MIMMAMLLVVHIDEAVQLASEYSSPQLQGFHYRETGNELPVVS